MLLKMGTKMSPPYAQEEDDLALHGREVACLHGLCLPGSEGQTAFQLE